MMQRLCSYTLKPGWTSSSLKVYHGYVEDIHYAAINGLGKRMLYSEKSCKNYLWFI